MLATGLLLLNCVFTVFKVFLSFGLFLFVFGSLFLSEACLRLCLTPFSFRSLNIRVCVARLL